MATVYITEYARAGMTSRAGVMAAEEPPLATQTVAIGVGSAQSAAFNVNTTLVRVSTDAVCSILFGANPTAAASSPRMPANSTEYFSVMPSSLTNQQLKVAVITNT